jgi:hypothetical protein
VVDGERNRGGVEGVEGGGGPHGPVCSRRKRMTRMRRRRRRRVFWFVACVACVARERERKNSVLCGFYTIPEKASETRTVRNERCGCHAHIAMAGLGGAALQPKSSLQFTVCFENVSHANAFDPHAAPPASASKTVSH